MSSSKAPSASPAKAMSEGATPMSTDPIDPNMNKITPRAPSPRVLIRTTGTNESKQMSAPPEIYDLTNESGTEVEDFKGHNQQKMELEMPENKKRRASSSSAQPAAKVARMEREEGSQAGPQAKAYKDADTSVEKAIQGEGQSSGCEVAQTSDQVVKWSKDAVVGLMHGLRDTFDTAGTCVQYDAPIDYQEMIKDIVNKLPRSARRDSKIEAEKQEQASITANPKPGSSSQQPKQGVKNDEDPKIVKLYEEFGLRHAKAEYRWETKMERLKEQHEEEVARLESKVAEMNKKTATLFPRYQGKIDQLKEEHKLKIRNTHQAQKTRLEEERKQHRREINDLKSTHAAAQGATKAAQTDALKEATSSHSNSIKEKNSEIRVLKKENSDLKKNVDDLELEVAEATDKIKNAEATVQDMKRTLDTAHAGMREQVDTFNLKAQELAKKIETLNTQLKNTQNQRDRHFTNNGELNDQIKSLKRDNFVLRSTISANESLTERLKAAVISKDKQIKEFKATQAEDHGRGASSETTGLEHDLEVEVVSGGEMGENVVKDEVIKEEPREEDGAAEVITDGETTPTIEVADTTMADGAANLGWWKNPSSNFLEE